MLFKKGDENVNPYIPVASLGTTVRTPQKGSQVLVPPEARKNACGGQEGNTGGKGALRPGKHTPAMNIQHETLREHGRGSQKPTGSVFQPAKCQFTPSKRRYGCWRLQGPVRMERLHIPAVSACIF